MGYTEDAGTRNKGQRIGNNFRPAIKSGDRVKGGCWAGGKPEWKRKQIEFCARMHAWLETAGRK